ncbi:hypothetical protein FB451DRAFT_1194686 [Mycena latifolia]|nr:hypothetical protein FB451DRAFT_1194686 [Mycena latifolia]
MGSEVEAASKLEFQARNAKTCSHLEQEDYCRGPRARPATGSETNKLGRGGPGGRNAKECRRRAIKQNSFRGTPAGGNENPKPNIPDGGARKVSTGANQRPIRLNALLLRAGEAGHLSVVGLIAASLNAFSRAKWLQTCDLRMCCTPGHTANKGTCIRQRQALTTPPPGQSPCLSYVALESQVAGGEIDPAAQTSGVQELGDVLDQTSLSNLDEM